jgi:hypothetical protein
MSANKLKFTLGIIATTGVVALSSVANAESAKSSAVGNILNRANLTIALSQSVPKEPTRKVDSDPKKVSPAINPNTGKVSPSLGNIPGKGGLNKKPSADDINFYCPKNGAIKKGTNNNRPSN